MSTTESTPAAAVPGVEALQDAVVAVPGAGGGAGPAVVQRLLEAGASVVAADVSGDALTALREQVVDPQPHYRHRYSGEVVDLLDADATHAWASRVRNRHGRTDGLIHLVGGWRGGVPFGETDLADWDWLHERLIRTLQHTSMAFHELLPEGSIGRFAIVSAKQATRPTGKNAPYASAKAAAEAWTMALAHSWRDTPASASVLVVKGLLTPGMRAAKPDAAFPGLTDVTELAEHVIGLWKQPATELNGARLWLTD